VSPASSRSATDGALELRRALAHADAEERCRELLADDLERAHRFARGVEGNVRTRGALAPHACAHAPAPAEGSAIFCGLGAASLINARGMESIFDRATALEPAGESRMTGTLDESFWVQAGPNGGFLTAIALRGAQGAVPEPERLPRSAHVRFLSPPRARGFELQREIVRQGRSMTIVRVQMLQDGRAFLDASFCFSAAYSTIAFRDASPPEVLPLAESEAVPKQIPLNHRFDSRRAIGSGFRSNARALSGGYIRFDEPRAIDVLALAALWDAWPPAVFARKMEDRFRGAVPTVEASIYFRAPQPASSVPPGEHVIIRVETRSASDGFAEEDAEIWSQGGVLLAQSRQLALLL
jgi:acyl-CoA thioesterase